MRGYHWGLIAIVFVLAVIFDRFFPQIGNAIPGIPNAG